MLAGPAGLAYAYGDPTAAARLLRDFARDHTRLLVKGALFGSEVLAPERVAALADLEPRPSCWPGWPARCRRRWPAWPGCWPPCPGAWSPP